MNKYPSLSARRILASSPLPERPRQEVVNGLSGGLSLAIAVQCTEEGLRQGWLGETIRIDRARSSLHPFHFPQPFTH
jgi:hypothetical protein